MVKTIKITKKYLAVPVDTGAALHQVFLYFNGEPLYDLKLRLSDKPNLAAWMDVSQFAGGKLSFKCETSEGIKGIHGCAKLPPKGVYKEELRPRLHYSAKCGWVNDPNGLVFADGLYHMFYQHNPYDTMWENMHWGHAVSRDLVTWEERGEALYPDKYGTMFSGCAVIDKQNTSKLGSVENPPMVLIYTAAGGANSVSLGRAFSVCAAISPDNGITFIKYSDNPVISNYVEGNRDPRVFWHEETKRWVMVIYLAGSGFAIFSSPNLLNWRYESELTLPPMIEMPDLFKIPGTQKWALLAGANFWGDGAVANYFTGTFDGKEFKKEYGPYPIDFGKDFYSLQTVSNAPEDKIILIGWRTRHLTQREKYGMPFNGEFSIPCEIFAAKINGELRLGRFPVRQFLDYPAKKRLRFNIKQTCEGGELFNFSSDAFSAEIEFLPGSCSVTEFSFGGAVIKYDSKNEVLSCFGKGVKVPKTEGKLKLYIIKDITSIEIYAQGGIYPVSGYTEPHTGGNRAYVYSGNIGLFTAEIKIRESIWKKQIRRGRQAYGKNING